MLFNRGFIFPAASAVTAKFFGGAGAGAYWTSPDGITWTSRNTGFSGSLAASIFKAGGPPYIFAQNTFIVTSADGVTWASRSHGFGAESVAGFAFGGGIYVAGSSASAKLVTSSDGFTWTSRTTGFGEAMSGIVFAGGQFVVITALSRLFTSSDGITWTSRTPGFGVNTGLSVTHNGTVYVATCAANRVFTSTDAITWTSRTSGFTAAANPMAKFLNGRLRLFNSSGGVSGDIADSSDGITWTSRVSQFPGSWQCMGFGNGVYVLSGQGAVKELASSTDGVTWTSRATEFVSNTIEFVLNSIIYG